MTEELSRRSVLSIGGGLALTATGVGQAAAQEGSAWASLTGQTNPGVTDGEVDGGPPADPGNGTGPPEDPSNGTGPPVDPGNGTGPPEDPGNGTGPPEEPGNGTQPPEDADIGIGPPEDAGVRSGPFAGLDDGA